MRRMAVDAFILQNVARLCEGLIQHFAGGQRGPVRLENKIVPSAWGIIYGFVTIKSPATIQTYMLIGSDDGVRIWLNDRLVHTNPAYRGCYPDQDRIPVTLKKGENKLLIKVLQGGGGWGFYVRFIDPDGKLRFSLEQ